MLDAHVHVWDAAVLDYPWLADAPALADHCTPDRIDRAQGAVTRMVFVEADVRPDLALAEARWVDGLEWPELTAIVAHADLRAGDALTTRLDELASIRRVRGIRHLLQADPVDSWRPDALAEGLRELGRRGLSFDACVRADQLPALAALLEQAPGTPTVLDHLGKPPVDAGPDSAAGREWQAGIALVAQLPNVHVKLSGLAAESTDAAAYDAHADAFLAAALSAFGERRCMIGSDWPVSARTGVGTSTSAWAARVRRVCEQAGASWEAVSDTNAARFYRV